MSNTLYQSKWHRLGRFTLMPLFLLLSCPPAAFLIWFINRQWDGSISLFIHSLSLPTLTSLWRPVLWGNSMSWNIIGIFMLIQLTLMRVVPGKKVTGPISPTGQVPEYKDNGFACFFITTLGFLGASYGLHWFSASIVYDNFAAIIGSLNIFSLVFCLMLYIKGRIAPSSPDHSSSGNFIFDYYWGTELYPRIAGFDIKQFTNCRFGMMSWPVIVLSFAAKQASLYGLSNSMLVAVIIQLVYIGKFFHWEAGYLRSTDIIHDRAGFYICWGCLVWVPVVYTSPIMFLVLHPVHLSILTAMSILGLGLLAIAINYMADLQRQKVRATDGQCRVWGKAPKVLKANYVTAQGEHKQNLLLTSGWWGLARHFHYVPEILAAFCWTVPAGFGYLLPYFYVIFLTILLTHRSYRDDIRCLEKYGDTWLEYRELVPARIIPLLYWPKKLALRSQS